MQPQSIEAKQASPADHSLRPRTAPDNSNHGDCIFTYHEILQQDSSYVYHVAAVAFKRHLAFISEVRDNASDIPQPKVTFDDGHCSNYEQAFPVLERTNVKATFFILAGCVGHGTNYVSWEHAKKMVDSGHCVASHGWSHRILT